MNLNNNIKELGETNNNVLPDHHHVNELEQIKFTPGSPNDQSTLSRTSRSSKIHPKSSTSVTPDKVHPRNDIVTMISYTL